MLKAGRKKQTWCPPNKMTTGDGKETPGKQREGRHQLLIQDKSWSLLRKCIVRNVILEVWIIDLIRKGHPQTFCHWPAVSQKSLGAPSSFCAICFIPNSRNTVKNFTELLWNWRNCWCKHSHKNLNKKFSHSVMSDSWWRCGLQHARLPCPSPTPGTYSNSCPSSQWRYLNKSCSINFLFISCAEWHASKCAKENLLDIKGKWMEM